jgi:hypothetical protein
MYPATMQIISAERDSGMREQAAAWWRAREARSVVRARTAAPRAKRLPQDGDMKQTCRQISQRVQPAREQGIIRYVYGKRG